MLRPIMSNIFEEQFWFRKVEALRVDELWIQIWKQLPVAHFEEAVEDDDEFHEIGRKKSASDIFWTLATNLLTEEHLFQNWYLPNCEALC
jgi:SPX domain protein involved in polyphosphate accumulation